MKSGQVWPYCTRLLKILENNLELGTKFNAQSVSISSESESESTSRSELLPLEEESDSIHSTFCRSGAIKTSHSLSFLKSKI